MLVYKPAVYGEHMICYNNTVCMPTLPTISRVIVYNMLVYKPAVYGEHMICYNN